MPTAKYESSDTTLVHPLELSQEKIDVAGNPEPAGEIASEIWYLVNKNDRERIPRCRGVVGQRTLELTVPGSDPPENFTKTFDIFLPILTEAVFDGAVFALNATFTYDDETYTVIARKGEDYN